MEVVINQQDLLNVAFAIQNIASPQASLPILENVMITTNEDSVDFTVTDLDISLKYNCKAKIIEQGNITVPINKFISVVKELPKEDINLKLKENTLIISFGKIKFKVNGLPISDFPSISYSLENSISISQIKLKRLLDMTLFTVSRDETKPAYNGVLLDIRGKEVRMVGTDSKRLAVIFDTLEEEITNNIKSIVSYKAAVEISKNLQGEGNIEIAINNNQICFKLNNIILVSRLIQDDFPNYDKAIPKYKSGIKIETKRFYDALKRVSVFTDLELKAITINIAKDNIVLFKKSSNMDEAQDEIEIKENDIELVLGINPVFINDILKTVCDKEIELEVTTSEKPVVIRKTNEYIYIILPMQLENKE